MKDKTFAIRLLAWYDHYGRHDLPWQINPTPYRVWVSEIMLQQTQVNTVIPYYRRFMYRFPNLQSLAESDINDVLQHWSGLGYYARARNLHKAAIKIQQQHNGEFPHNIDELVELPGIGKSTAGAIASFAMGQSTAILDGNVKRVLTRHFAYDQWPGSTAAHKELWQWVEELTPKSNTHKYNQAIMDLGATICTRSKPLCPACPILNTCAAYKQGNPTQYPIKKPKKQNPVKSSYFLIIQNQNNQILLQQRPDYGIWGGLWCFPEIDADSDILDHCRREYSNNILDVEKLAEFTHKFSHYTLKIKPVWILVEAEHSKVMDNNSNTTHWHDLNSDAPGGIPKPVSHLLNQLKLGILHA